MQKVNNYLLLLILSILTVLFGLISNELLDSKKLILDSLATQFTHQQINKIIDFQNKWEWVSFVLIPFLLLIKTSVIAAIIDIGCFFFNKDIKYKKLFNIVIKAEFVFLLVVVFKTLWFYWFKEDYTLEDLQYFYPLSAINITGYQDLQAWFVYPLQVLNLFELAYWFILAYLLGKALNENTDKGLGIVASSYGVGLLIWVVAVMFFTLNMS